MVLAPRILPIGGIRGYLARIFSEVGFGMQEDISIGISKYRQAVKSAVGCIFHLLD